MARCLASAGITRALSKLSVGWSAQFARAFMDLAQAMARLGKPIIAAINGNAHAGGFSLVVACDMAVVAEDGDSPVCPRRRSAPVPVPRARYRQGRAAEESVVRYRLRCAAGWMPWKPKACTLSMKLSRVRRCSIARWRPRIAGRAPITLSTISASGTLSLIPTCAI